MNTIFSKNLKRYINPEITKITLDNEISLVLQSNVIEPPSGPNEITKVMDTMNSDPYRNA